MQALLKLEKKMLCKQRAFKQTFTQQGSSFKQTEEKNQTILPSELVL